MTGMEDSKGLAVDEVPEVDVVLGCRNQILEILVSTKLGRDDLLCRWILDQRMLVST